MPLPRRRPPESNRWLLVLAGVVVLLIVVAVTALYAVVPGDPEGVDEVLGGTDVNAHDGAVPAPGAVPPAP